MEALLASNCTLPRLPAQKSQTIKDPKDWNSLIKYHAKLKNDNAILSTYTHMESLRIVPDNTALPLVLKACSALNSVEIGKRIHSSVLGTELSEDVRVATALIDFYCKAGLLDHAKCVFDEMFERDIIAWNAILYGYVGAGQYEEAISLFSGMVEEGWKPNSRTIVALLLACKEAGKLKLGREIHGYCLRHGVFDMNLHVGTTLIGFYAKFDWKASCSVFDMMVVKNVVCWNAMITGYFEVGDYERALEVFVQLLWEGFEFDSITILLVAQACAECGSLELAMQSHQVAVKFGFLDDLCIVDALLNMYKALGRLDFACRLFEANMSPDVAFWNSMISVYIEFGKPEEALGLFLQMNDQGVRANERTIVIVLSSCSDFDGGLGIGKSLHAHAIKVGMKMDPYLGNEILHMYGELNCIEAAKKVFDRLKNHADVVSWNILIAGVAKSEKMKHVVWEIFLKMQSSVIKPNSHTIIPLLASCQDDTDLNMGRALHGYAIKDGIQIDTPLSTALTEMYMNCGDEVTARSLFNCCPSRDIISWNSLIASYIKNNQTHKALLLFQRMCSEVEPNSVTLINILSSCIHLADLSLGRCIHAYITRKESSFGLDLSLMNSLLTMYARCGSLENARKIFLSLSRRDVISWNALITGYGMHGRGHDAISSFNQMLEDGFRPNKVTFVSVLSACSHSGLIDEGLQLFSSMSRNFNVSPELIHYGCVVDLLGRGGHLNEALHFIHSMPIEPDASLWRALLSACQVYSDTKLVEPVFEKLIELEPMNEGNYVLLSNIYASAGLWSEVRRVRKTIKEKGLRKPPGISWIVIRNVADFFTAGDRSHMKSDMIYEVLRSLLCLIKDAGYVPEFQWALLNEEN
ncbi:hypothetical protein CDL15_Pgr026589 [Punica granatum]|uniref:Uncharacterized protein n=1 Tax=Punica granatum TaxID=22663 RepID=A0A218WMB6_PUNGR|nr:hypothetical protein CDL15_Pgr026589 [Punica granatum]